MKSVLTNLATIGLAVLVGLVGLEIVLRLWPGLMSPAVVANFERPLRRQVAERLDLPLKQARRCIAPEERSDGGPELCLIAPQMTYRQPVDPADVALGAEAVLLHDGRGFCNPPQKVERPQAVIVSLGDSFTWCSGVAPEATFTALLEPALGVTTYDLGVPGVGPYEYLEILRRFGLALEPRLVLLDFYEGNDLRDADRFAKQIARASSAPGGGGGSSAPAARDSLGEMLLDHSYALNFVAGSVEHLAEQWRPQEIDFRYQVAVRGQTTPINGGQTDRDEVEYARKLGRGEIGPQLWDRALDDFATLAGAYGFIPVVTYIPTAYTAYARTVVFADPTIGPDLAAMSRAQRKHLQRQSEARGLAFVDLTAAVQAAVVGAELAYFPFNLHLTPAGHQIVASALAPKLEALLAGDAGAR
jgi:hypothetical protein